MEEDNIVFIILKIIVFCVFAFIMIKMVKIYLKNIELKQDPEKNKEEIKENFDKIKNIIAKFIKIGSIVFTIIMVMLIILSNFIEF